MPVSSIQRIELTNPPIWSVDQPFPTPILFHSIEIADGFIDVTQVESKARQ